MKIRVFEWDLKNRNHVKKHGVDPEEVEEVLITNNYLRKTRQGRYIAYGSTLLGRLLTVVFIYKGNGRVRVITARDMDYKEKKAYRKKKEIIL